MQTCSSFRSESVQTVFFDESAGRAREKLDLGTRLAAVWLASSPACAKNGGAPGTHALFAHAFNLPKMWGHGVVSLVPRPFINYVLRTAWVRGYSVVKSLASIQMKL